MEFELLGGRYQLDNPIGRGIVHRAIVPQHILMGSDGSIKLSSFSTSSVKSMNHEELSTAGTPLNNVSYYPAEQISGEIVTPATDVYALGMVMYVMLIGHTPFDGDSPVAVAMQHMHEKPVPPRQINPNIPVSLEEIIMRCLEKEPEKRFRDGSQLARALEQWSIE
jgi:eukaryotic-like serine/threonine-protein kinase